MALDQAAGRNWKDFEEPAGEGLKDNEEKNHQIPKKRKSLLYTGKKVGNPVACHSMVSEVCLMNPWICLKRFLDIICNLPKPAQQNLS